jgi:hypothetical protein
MPQKKNISKIQNTVNFVKPPRWSNAEGNERRVGFEFELSGITINDCATLIKNMFGGKINFFHSLLCEINDTSVGTFKVELDSQLVQKISSSLENTDDITELEDLIGAQILFKEASKYVGYLAGQFVPLEIVTPPLIFQQLPEIEKLREELYENNAEGTRSGLVNAFGFHINPEVPSFEANDILDYLKAFLILYPWLKDIMDIDLTRRMLTYIDPFPENYVKLILEYNYKPTLDKLIDDYLEYNPTRNRALDILPLFYYLRPEKILALDEAARKKVKARPAFHYRLPNCEVNNKNWLIARDWNYWVEVEKLAEDKEMLDEMSQKYLNFLYKNFHSFSDEWIRYTYKQLRYDLY